MLALGLGVLLGIDHPGWASTSALLVGRPNPALTSQRVAGRAISVVVGSSAALLLAIVDASPFLLAVCVALALATLTALTGSRWYVTAGFTSFIVLTMMMLRAPEESSWWFAERIAGTLYGVTIAWILLDLVPRLRSRGARPAPASDSTTPDQAGSA